MKMCKTVPVDVSGVDFSRGDIYTKDMNQCLTDDMFWAEVGEYAVDVSWYPEHDPSGCYHITMIKGVWDNKLYTRQLEDPFKVAKLVQGLIKECIELRNKNE